MVFPDDFDDDAEDELDDDPEDELDENPEDELDENPKDREEYREAWFEIEEDEEVSEDEISASETRKGGDSLPDPFDEDVLSDGIDEMMHEEDEK